MKTLFADFRKTFGSGPAGVVVSLVLLFIAFLINRQLNLPPLTDHQPLLNGIFIAAIVLTLGIIAWSLRSLPAADRGNRLCTSGAFRYVRHRSMPHSYPSSTLGSPSGSTVTFTLHGHCSCTRYGITLSGTRK